MTGQSHKLLSVYLLFAMMNTDSNVTLIKYRDLAHHSEVRARNVDTRLLAGDMSRLQSIFVNFLEEAHENKQN